MKKLSVVGFTKLKREEKAKYSTDDELILVSYEVIDEEDFFDV